MNLGAEVLNLLSASLNDNVINNIENWQKVLAEMKEQAVFCLPYDIIRKSECLPANEFLQYRMLCYQNIAKSTQLLNEQKQMLTLFQENDIPVVILKGASAAMYYPHPEYRTMGDIDIIVKPEDFEKAYRILGNHYLCNQTLDENPRHVGFICKSGVEIELHKFFTFGERTKQKDLLDQIIYNAIDRREWHEIRGSSFPSLPAIENGLVLLNHIYQHLQAGGIGYRQMIDFEEYIKSEKSNIDSFLEAADKVGLAKLAKVMICIYMQYMGLSIDNVTINTDEAIMNNLLSEFSHSGNFGHKEARDAGKRSELVLRKARNPFVLLALLQKNGRVHWKATERCFILRPFAWIYQIGYYIKQVKLNGGLSVVSDGKRRIQDKEKMLNELGL